jgi:hypothetical protein
MRAPATGRQGHLQEKLSRLIPRFGVPVPALRSLGFFNNGRCRPNGCLVARDSCSLRRDVIGAQP